MSKEKGARSSPLSRFIDTGLLKPPYSDQALRKLIRSTPIQAVSYLASNGVKFELDVLRTDLIDLKLGGNKLFKLWGYASDIGDLDVKPDFIASFGGAYSNHLYALAALGEKLDLSTIGFVRGEKPKRFSSTLRDVQSMGMKLYFISRASYGQITDPSFKHELVRQHSLAGSIYWIPEGGRGLLGMAGCEVLGSVLSGLGYTHIVHACGTGTTLAGLCRGADKAQKDRENSQTSFVGISALRSNSSTVREIMQYTDNLTNPVNWLISNQFHHGGFAKLSDELDSFMHIFYEQTAIPIDRVYTGKMFYALSQMYSANFFKKGSRILAIHSGGTQGNRS